MKYILIFLFISASAAAQTRTNLEIFQLMLDSALAETPMQEIPDSTFYFNAGDANTAFYTKAAARLMQKNLKSGPFEESSLLFIIEETEVKYGEMFRNGFMGNFYMPRDLKLKGNFLSKETNRYKEFQYQYSDIIAVDSAEYVENEIYPFTRGEIPPEPFFSSILEPAIAIGTTALAVILFFSVRSK